MEWMRSRPLAFFRKFCGMLGISCALRPSTITAPKLEGFLFLLRALLRLFLSLPWCLGFWADSFDTARRFLLCVRVIFLGGTFNAFLGRQMSLASCSRWLAQNQRSISSILATTFMDSALNCTAMLETMSSEEMQSRTVTTASGVMTQAVDKSVHSQASCASADICCSPSTRKATQCGKEMAPVANLGFLTPFQITETTATIACQL